MIELKSSISYLNCLHFYYNQDLFEKSFLDGLFGDYWLEEYFLISIIEKTYQIFDKLGIFLDNIYNLKLKKKRYFKTVIDNMSDNNLSNTIIDKS